MTGWLRAASLGGLLSCSLLVTRSAAAQSSAPSPAPAPAPSPPGDDADAWYRRAPSEARERKLESERKAQENREREAEERRKWFAGLSAGAGVSEGKRDFRADYMQLSLAVSRYSLPLSSPSNAFLSIEVPIRRYFARDGDIAWGTGMFVFGGVQEWWVFASAGLGATLIPGAERFGALGVRGRLGFRLWRFTLAGEAGGACGVASGDTLCLGDLGGVLAVDLVRPWGVETETRTAP